MPKFRGNLPQQTIALHRAMRRHLPELCVIGGCCGTDHRHVDEACSALAARA